MAEIRRYGIIFASDETDPDKAYRILDDVEKFIDGIKIGITATVIVGSNLIRRIRKTFDKPVIADFKIADIGFREDSQWQGTNSKIVEELAEAGADYITCHAFPGIGSLQESVEVAHQHGTKVFTLPSMTPPDSELFFRHPLDQAYSSKILEKYGYPSELLKNATTFSDLILNIGEFLNVDGYIGPANLYENGKLVAIERYRQFTKKPIFSPGIGRQTTESLSLQNQLLNFYRAAGSDSAAIVGSSIYEDKFPRNVAFDFFRWRDAAEKQLEIVKKTKKKSAGE